MIQVLTIALSAIVALIIAHAQSTIAGLYVLHRAEDKFASHDVVLLRKQVGRAFSDDLVPSNEDLRQILNIFEEVAAALHTRTLSFRIFWTTEFADVAYAYLVTFQDYQNRMKGELNSYYSECEWLAGKMRRYAYRTGVDPGVRRVVRMLQFWKQSNELDKSALGIICREIDTFIPTRDT